jgi:protein-tyrosine phosphatase
MGNICRSPTAEGALRALLAREAPDLSVDVDSAGTHGYHVGEPPDARSIEHARRRGFDLRALRARRLVPEDFEHFDWVLCMDAANLAAARRIQAGRGTARVALFLDSAAGTGTREVPDPYYGDADGFEHVLDLVEAGARGLIEELRRHRAGSSSGPTQEV